jgi:hypothetical protein
MEHALSTALGRRCGSAAYLSDVDITSSSWLHPYSLIKIEYYKHNTHSSLIDSSNTYPSLATP